MFSKCSINKVLDVCAPSIHATYTKLKNFYHWWQNRSLIQKTKEKYGETLSQVRRKYAAGRPIRVMFLLFESSKWKCQALYDALEASPDFEPFVALTRMDVGRDFVSALEEFAPRITQSREFCVKRGVRFVEAYSLSEAKPLDLAVFHPDIVFYPSPWNMPQCQMPDKMACSALTCYIPYYVVCHDAAIVDAQRPLHFLVYRYFTTNDSWCGFFLSKSHGFPYAGEFVGIGHPMLDCFAKASKAFSQGDIVIYAPHCTILGGLKYSTFLENGDFILEYAKHHPEVQWCFKPHPLLRRNLHKEAQWPEEKINAYYDEWEKIGMVCYTGDYPELFLRSRALITDCSSFLMEYSAVNRPLIHLIRKDTLYRPAQPCERLFDSFYKVHGIDELAKTLKSVIEDFQDPHAAAREAAIKDLNLWHVRCADNIVKYLREILKG